MIDISKSFSQTSEPVSNFFQQPGVGYYIPLYQREYSWDTENVEQLIDDIFNGVKSLVQEDKNARDRAIHFMGTVILFQESNPKVNIQPRDDRALPTRIDNVIDGQQRISTIALLACALLANLSRLGKKLPKDAQFDALRTEIQSKKELLLELFSVDIKRGEPKRKAIIIRGSIDGWTFDGKEEDNYKSGITSYLAACIRSAAGDWKDPPKRPSDRRVARNLQEIERWLRRVEEVGPNDENDFPRAKEILGAVPEEMVWTYPRPELLPFVKNPSEPPTKIESTLASLVQVFAFIHYLGERCCFTVIKPVSEDWAFDMFQSLNASGTPLTAIETFKPLVVNYIAQEGQRFKDTKSAEWFSKMDMLIGETGPTAKKNKLTDEFLTAYALTYDGSPISTQFSIQRRWLNDSFKGCKSPEEREEFVRRMGDLATYWENVLNFEPNNNLAIAGLEELSQDSKRLSGVCVLYLREAGHKMANTILSRYYARVLRSDDKSAPQIAQEFVDVCKAVAAFYTLWRAAQTNSGLDEVYRKLLRSGDKSNGIEQMSWAGGENAMNVEKLKLYFRNALGDLFDRTAWIKKATNNLRVDFAKPVCKFALFVSAHDTIADPASPGLMKIGVPGTHAYLEPVKWASNDFKTIEHIAPQKGEQGNWDVHLYDNDLYQRIGNLTLLPVDVNSSAGNLPWKVKSIYYRHLAEQDPAKLELLQDEAKNDGVALSPHTIDLLRNASHSHYMRPIVEVPANAPWDKALVESRTERICEILWDRVAPWLAPA